MKDLQISPDSSRPTVHLDLGVEMFGHLDDVLADTRLATQAKRELLASWASDANAVPHIPWLRQLPDGSLVNVTKILDALKTLDAHTKDTATPRAWLWQLPFKRRRGTGLRDRGSYSRSSDDDDDPPPCPAYAARQPRSGGGASFAFPEAVPA
jgi:hypothetical protein